MSRNGRTVPRLNGTKVPRPVTLKGEDTPATLTEVLGGV